MRDEVLPALQVGLHFHRIVDAVVAPAIELLVWDLWIVPIMDAAGGFGQTVGHDRAGADDDVGQRAVDHLAQNEPHLGHRHGPGHGHDDGAIRVGGHGRENVKGLAQFAPAKGGASHPPQKIGKTAYAPNVEGFQRL